MKKLIALFLVATVLSCSSEDHENQNVASLAENSGSVLDGKVLSFKNEESFVKEYSDLATLSKEELQKWISSKRVVSLLNTADDSAEMEEDVISDSRIIYSDALKSILNAESKVKIDGKVLWLNERNFYLLSENEINKGSKELLDVKGELVVYGQLLSVSEANKSLSGRSVIPNENRIKVFESAEMNVSGSRLRHVVDLYNETIVLNDIIQTSKMFLRSKLQYRSCSTLGGCKWKEAFNSRILSTDFYCQVCGSNSVWGPISGTNSTAVITGTQTYLLSQWKFKAPLVPEVNFTISGPITCHIVGSNPAAAVSINLSWY